MRLKLVLTSFIVSIIFNFGLAGGVFAKLSIPSAPPLDRPIVDQTQTLSNEDIVRISTKINEQRAKKSFQIAVLMIPTLGNDDSLEDYSISVARQWGVGEKKVSNGVLILIAKDDRKMRIEVGDGMEGALTDAQASRIIRNIMAPKFRQNDFAGGVEVAVMSIIDLSEGREVGLRDEPEVNSIEDIMALILFSVVFIVPFVGSILARSKNWWAGGVIGGIVGVILMVFWSFTIGSIVAAVILSILGFIFDFLVSRDYREAKEHGRNPSWWAGGGSIGGSGGGFSGGSFGGGGFSGGGASGGW